MNDFPKRQLLINYLLGLCTPGEEKEVEHWLDKEPGNSALLQEVAKEIGHDGSLPKVEKEEIKKQVLGSLNRPEELDLNHGKATDEKSNVSKTAMRGLWLKVAAVLLLVLTAGGAGFYYSTSLPGDKQSEVVFKRKALSAGQKATLRFGDGSVIELNSESTLRYPSRFDADKREVYLEGEAFFSVQRDTTRPFIVHAGGTTTRVLGTAFNIRAYKEEGELQVAVTEGKVAVAKEKAEQSAEPETIHISKDQWVTYSPAGQLVEKGEGDLWEMTAWKDDVLVFNDRSLGYIAGRLERWYNIDIKLADSSLANRRMSATFDGETVSNVLNIISLTLDVEYKREGRKISFQKADKNGSTVS